MAAHLEFTERGKGGAQGSPRMLQVRRRRRWKQRKEKRKLLVEPERTAEQRRAGKFL